MTDRANAAGIILESGQGTILLVKRSSSNEDHAGEWAFPGGKIEEGEKPLEAAIRECVEEVGFNPRVGAYEFVGSSPTPRGDFHAYYHLIPREFDPKIDNESDDADWFNPHALPYPMLPGAEMLIKSRYGVAPPMETNQLTEMDVMEGIRDGHLPSPQLFGDVYLFAIRVSGTGMAERSNGEIGYKNPNDYLTAEFLKRCAGLPVIWTHPDKLLLDTDSFREQIVGTSALPYIAGDEVWTIARIYDKDAAKLMQEKQLSTSPAVTVSPDATKIGNVLIEGDPVYVDHIAICENGVWDKKLGPTGVRVDSITIEDKPMEEEKTGGDIRAMLADMLSEHSARMDAKFDEMTNRLDAMSGSAEKADDALDPEEKAEVKEEIQTTEHVVKDDDCMSGEKADDMPEMKADSSSEEMKEKTEKADSVRADSAELIAMRKELAELRKAVTPQGMDEREEIAKAIHRADSVFMAMGEKTPIIHVPGESAFSFRKRIAARLSKFSDRFKDVNIGDIADVKLFTPIEEAIYADSMDYTKAPPVSAGQVHMIEKKRGALTIYEPSANSDPHGWMDAFSNGVQYRGRFIQH
jgi:8-oxo-dGTP pyrophosphatase MutT (NUDIX family)